ncbi:thioredoxin [Candidatus Pacearchaeota archaeon]|nr:thioredoxin [Candidatus Pacearchaeota archaeon]
MHRIIKEVTSENFDEFVSKGNSIAYFWAVWCGPCKMLGPVFEEVAKEMIEKVKFGKVDVDEQQDLANQMEIMSIPTMIFFKNGEQIGRNSGYMNKKEFSNMIKNLFEN